MMSLRSRFIQHLRGEFYQPLWERLARVAQVGMNHWGGSHFRHSGEAAALDHVSVHRDHQFGYWVLDIGANQGDYTEMALGIVPADIRFICFEPSGPTRSILERKLAGPIKNERVLVVASGMGSSEGSMSLFVPNEGDSVASLYAFDPHTRPWKESGQEVVPIVTFDGFCESNRIEHVLLAKIDVEGHELHVLHGAERMIKEGRIQFIQFEFGEAHIDARSFFLDHFRLLEDRYDLFRILPKGLRRIPAYSPDLEVFRTANYLAVFRS
jgi:FkbM family methyltransferase